MRVLDRPTLVVDDSKVVRLVLSDLLRDLGFQDIHTASSTQEGIEAYSRLRPGLVFLDITMPEVPGTRMARHILHSDPRAKVVVVSAMSRDDELVESVISEGVYDYIRKPVRRDALVALVARLEEDEAMAQRAAAAREEAARPSPVGGDAGPEGSSRKPLQDP